MARLILILIHRIQPCRIDFELPHRVQFIPQCMFNALDTNIPDIDTTMGMIANFFSVVIIFSSLVSK